MIEQVSSGDWASEKHAYLEMSAAKNDAAMPPTAMFRTTTSAAGNALSSHADNRAPHEQFAMNTKPPPAKGAMSCRQSLPNGIDLREHVPIKESISIAWFSLCPCVCVCVCVCEHSFVFTFTHR